MLETLLRFSLAQRWLIIGLVSAFAALGVYDAFKLPIDAVPDITNVQIQINTEAPGYSPVEAEQRVSYIVENAMAGLPRLDYTRSLSRYGLSQVTVVFEDGTDIYFARQLVAERIEKVKTALPSGLSPEMGPISTGLGEIFMFTVDADPAARRADGKPYDAYDLHDAMQWIVKPQLAQVRGVTEVNSIGGYERQLVVAPQPSKLLAYGLNLDDLTHALDANNANRGAGYIDQHGAQIRGKSGAGGGAQVGQGREQGVPAVEVQGLHLPGQAVEDRPGLRQGIQPAYALGGAAGDKVVQPGRQAFGEQGEAPGALPAPELVAEMQGQGPVEVREALDQGPGGVVHLDRPFGVQAPGPARRAARHPGEAQGRLGVRARPSHDEGSHLGLRCRGQLQGPAARADGPKQAPRGMADQQQDTPRRRLLQGLQEGVGGVAVQVVGSVDNRNPVWRGGGRHGEEGVQAADLLNEDLAADLAVGVRAVHQHEVGMGTLGHQP
jgi:hypothetical protein